jgi:riboflavin kinase/FMN adenylyltransferase
MKLLRRLPWRLAGARPIVLGLGVFDGMHLGHQAVLAAARSLARERAWLSGALSFEGPPEAVLGQPVPPRLGHPDDDTARMAALGLDLQLRIPFTKALARLSADAFVRNVLQRRLRCRAVAVGRGFRFGAGAKGDAALLRRLGLEVVELAPLKVRGQVVSSTRLREAVQAGRLAEAARLLGRPWVLRGRVVKGRGMGRRLGFPTANVDSPQRVLPPQGVWAGRCRTLDGPRPGGWRPFVANLGRRPTFGPGGELSVELHLLGFRGSLLGRCLEATFVRFLRPERRFSGVEALRVQLERDRERAAAILHRQGFA